MRIEHIRTGDRTRTSLFVVMTVFFFFFGQMVIYGQIPNWGWVVQAGGSGVDYANSVVVDFWRNVFVVGYQDNATFGAGETNETMLTTEGGFIAKYDPNGTLIWVKGIIGGDVIDIAIDSNNDLFILGSFASSVTFAPGLINELTIYVDDHVAPGNDCYIAKYSASGDFIWLIHPKFFPFDYPDDIAIDSRDYIVELVNGYQSPSSSSGLTVQWDHSGGLLWYNNMPGPAPRKYLQGVCVDNLNNCYVTGWLDFVLTHEMVSVKYDDAGDEEIVITTRGDAQTYGHDICVDSDGFIYITGTSFGDATFGAGEPNETVLSTTSTIPFLAKYYPNGDLLWVKKRNTRDIAFDPGDYLYTAGFISGATTFGLGGPNEITVIPVGHQDLYIAKYDSSGSFLWVKHAGSGLDDRVNDLFVDQYGIAHVAGYFQETVTFGSGETYQKTLISEGDKDIFIARMGIFLPRISGVVFFYPSITMMEGVQLNFQNLGMTHTKPDGYYEMEVPFGWCGQVLALLPGVVFDIPILTYNFVSSDRVNQDYWVLGPPKLPIAGYVTLQSNQQPMQNVTVTFDNNGGSAVTNENGYYINQVPYRWKGTATPSLDSYVFNPVSIKYAEMIRGWLSENYVVDETGVEDTEAIPTRTEFYANYPNPFNTSTTLTYSLSSPTYVCLDIYDMNGRLIKHLHNGRQEPGTFTVQWHGKDDNGLYVSSGIYTCRMTTNQNIFRQKLILIK